MPDLRSKPPSGRMELQVSCSKCGWMYSTRNDHCPMCGAPLLLDLDTLVKALMEYVELQGTWIDKKEAKKYIEAYKKKFKKLPDLDTLWKTAIKLAKLEEMSEEELKKEKQKAMKGKPAAKKEDTVKRKMEELKEKKLKEKKQKELKKKQKKEKKARAAGIGNEIICPKCGEKNPPDSLFCLNCGTKLK